MKHWFYCLLLGLSSTLALGQEVEQLHAELDKVTTDTARAHVLSRLSEAYLGVDSVKVFKYGYQALAIFRRTGNADKIGQMYYLLGKNYYSYLEVEKAKRHFLLAKAQFEHLLATDSSEHYLQWWSRCTFNVSVMLGEQGLVDQEIKNYLLIDQVAETDAKLQAIVCSNLAIRFHNLEQYHRAYDYFVEGQAFYRRIDAPSQFIYHRLLFADCLHEMDSLSRMRVVLDEVEHELDTMPVTAERVLYHLTKGIYFNAKEASGLALSQYDTAYHLATTTQMTLYLKEVLRHYVDTYLSLGDSLKAKHYLTYYTEEAKRHARFSNELLVIDAWARYEAQTQNYKKAFAHLRRYVTVEDSLDSVLTEQRINELEVTYQTQQKENEISLLERQNYRASLTIARERSRSYLYLLIFGVVVTLIFSGSYVFFRKKQHEAEQLQQERKVQLQALQHQQQTQVLSALIEGQEKERQRLASDLHDGLAGRLSGIAFTLSKFTNAPPRTPTVRDVQRVRDHINSSLDELRYIARNLTPQTLSEQGMKVALEDYCSSLEGSHSRIVLQCYDTEAPPKTSVSLTLYRIVQELIHNAVKYARASEILVQYIREGPRIEITVEDDGVGFDPVHLSSSSQMGLTNIRTRVDYLNGTLEIQSAPGEGTTVWVQVHLPAPSSEDHSSPA